MCCQHVVPKICVIKINIRHYPQTVFLFLNKFKLWCVALPNILKVSDLQNVEMRTNISLKMIWCCLVFFKYFCDKEGV